MKNVTDRSRCLWMLVIILLLGSLIFAGKYCKDAESWAFHPQNMRVYRKGSMPASGILTDRNGLILRNFKDDRFSSDLQLRQAVLHWTGDRQGNIPAWATLGYSRQMMGYSWVNGLYRYASAPAQVQLTLSAELQKAALAAMGDHAGTLAVYNYKTGEILCAVSTPGFDPEQPPEQPENGVYVNRFVQGLYTPGSIFKVVTTAAALEKWGDMEAWHYTCTGSHTFGEEKVSCRRAHGDLSLKDAMMRSCNCAYAALATQLGGAALKSYVAQFGVLDRLTFDGMTTAQGKIQLTGNTSIDVAWSAIGQHADLVNPCAFLTFIGAVANDGRRMQPYIVESVGEVYHASAAPWERILSEQTAKTLQQWMHNNVVSNYGAEHFPGLIVCAKTGTAELGNGSTNALFAGFLRDEVYPYAFLIVAEGGSSGKNICVPIAAKLFAAIKNAPSA